MTIIKGYHADGRYLELRSGDLVEFRGHKFRFTESTDPFMEDHELSLIEEIYLPHRDKFLQRIRFSIQIPSDGEDNFMTLNYHGDDYMKEIESGTRLKTLMSTAIYRAKKTPLAL